MAYVSYGKLSKKSQREIDRVKRSTWEGISPVTKKVASKKVYSRKKTQRWQRESPMLGFYYNIKELAVMCNYCWCCGLIGEQP